MGLQQFDRVHNEYITEYITPWLSAKKSDVATNLHHSLLLLKEYACEEEDTGSWRRGEQKSRLELESDRINEDKTGLDMFKEAKIKELQNNIERLSLANFKNKSYIKCESNDGHTKIINWIDWLKKHIDELSEELINSETEHDRMNTNRSLKLRQEVYDRKKEW